MVLLYACRGDDDRVRWLAPYEFARCVDTRSTTLPTSRKAAERDDCHTHVAESNWTNRQAGKQPSPGDGNDYTVKDSSAGWLGYPPNEYTEYWPHDWIMVFRPRPAVPAFTRSPLPRSRQRSE